MDISPFIFLGTIAIAGAYILYCEMTPNKRFYYDKYKYVTRNGGFGVDLERMIVEDPEYFEERYLKEFKKFRKHYEARGHTFKNGKIDPPIVIND